MDRQELERSLAARLTNVDRTLPTDATLGPTSTPRAWSSFQTRTAP